MKESLKTYNTFNVESYTSKIIKVNQLIDLNELQKHDFSADDFLIIGAGSNLLLLEDAPDTIIAMRLTLRRRAAQFPS